MLFWKIDIIVFLILYFHYYIWCIFCLTGTLMMNVGRCVVYSFMSFCFYTSSIHFTQGNQMNLNKQQNNSKASYFVINKYLFSIFFFHIYVYPICTQPRWYQIIKSLIYREKKGNHYLTWPMLNFINCFHKLHMLPI